MIQITIRRDGQITNQASFPTQEEAQAWLSSHEGMGTFGHKDIFADQEILISEEVRGPVTSLISEAVIDEDGLEITPAVYEINEDVLISPAMYELQSILISPATYSVEITDITAQLEQERINVVSRKYLDDTDWYVIRSLEGTPVPSGILTERALARSRII